MSIELKSEREVDGGIVLGDDGAVLFNAWQMDDSIICKDYEDGTRELYSKRTGKLIIAPFKPHETKHTRCPHCHGQLGGDPA